MSDFLQEEWRDGFFVDKKRKALWQTELNIIAEIDRICLKYDIGYCVLGGALIGAVRHKGFIPWDDDMDIGMLRDDYNAFISVAEKELSDEFELQEGTRDPNYYDVIIRVRDKKTTGILRRDLGRETNNGIFIEIYPLDSVNPNRFLLKSQLIKFRVLNNILHFYCYPDRTTIKKRMETLVAKFSVNIFGREKIYRRLCKVVSKYNGKGYPYVDILVTRYNCKYLYDDIKDRITVPYEYLNLYIPKGYDRCLSTTYGDYMKMPPEEKRIEHHKKVVYYDPFHPYTDSSVKKSAEEYFNS